MLQTLEVRPTSATVAVGTDAREYLTFRLGKEEYGIDILKVQEIRSYDAVTAIANAPEFIKGVVNLRGTIVPIVDLRIKFNVGDAHYDAFTVVIILNIARRVVGVVVDSVSDVLTLQGGDQAGARVRHDAQHPVHPGAGHRRRADADPGRHRAPDDRRRHGADGPDHTLRVARASGPVANFYGGLRSGQSAGNLVSTRA